MITDKYSKKLMRRMLGKGSNINYLLKTYIRVNREANLQANFQALRAKLPNQPYC